MSSAPNAEFLVLSVSLRLHPSKHYFCDFECLSLAFSSGLGSFFKDHQIFSKELGNKTPHGYESDGSVSLTDP